MTILTLAAALAVQLLPTPGAVRWEVVAVESDGQTWIDPASLSRQSGIARFILRVETDQARADGIGMLVTRVVVDCGRRRMGLEAADAYGLNGAFRESRQVRGGQVAYQPLGTEPAHAALYRRVCEARAS